MNENGSIDNLGTQEFPALNPFPQVTYQGDVTLNDISGFFRRLADWFQPDMILLALKVLLVVFTLITIAIGVYFFILQQEERGKRYEWLKKYIGNPDDGYQKKPKTRWDYVATLFRSKNEADWRMGIIEADAMLDDLLIRLGYQGNSLGERLRSVNPADFPKRNVAWKAHLIRNKIAHEGASFQLSHMQALRVMRWYEEVFRHAQYIR